MNPNRALLFEINIISNYTNTFDEFESKGIKYAYLTVNNKHILFCYSHKEISTDFIFESVDVLSRIDAKERKIRSMRGFLTYILEMMKKSDFKILSTNLPKLFWQDVAGIIRQNKKDGLQNFLFNQNKTENLEDRILSIERRLINLEKYFNQSFKKEIIKNTPEFKVLKELEAKEKVEIIEKSFKVQKEENIGLKEFYEGESPQSLFSWKNFKIKFNSIRRDDDYKKLKAKN